MTTATAGCVRQALGPVVDALVAEPVGDLCLSELQDRIASVGRQVDRLGGWLSLAGGELQARTGGMVATDTGTFRSVAGWVAEQRRDSPSTVGSALKTATALRSLPLVSAAVLDGVLTPAQAAVLARLVGLIPEPALAEAQPELILVAATRNPVELAAWVRHLIATHCEPVLDDDAESARRRRFLQTSTDGALVRGRFALPGEDAEALLTALEPLARRQG